MKFSQDRQHQKKQPPVGILSYGVYLPRWAILAAEIERANGQEPGSVSGSLGVKQKTVPSIDEDTITISIEAASQAFLRSAFLEGIEGEIAGEVGGEIGGGMGGEATLNKPDSKKSKFKPLTSKKDPRSDIGAIFIGSESHPYAVKPSGTVVKQALGLPRATALADLQFACKAGTQALQICAAYAAAGLISAGLAIGADTAQAEPGDALEYTAAAGGGAYLVGASSEKLVAQLVASCSSAQDIPDFWRRPGQKYPQHAGRFTGDPSYFNQVQAATQDLLNETGLIPEEIDFCIFHTPNAKFPRRAAKKLGFKPKQLEPSLVVEKIGNTYAGASMIALAAVLDQAQADQTILLTSYGSGAGADSFLFKTTPFLVEARSQWKKRSGSRTALTVKDQVRALKTIDYQTYRSWLAKRGH
ncbi:MAG: hydroxymethylglutaryl-CoA synthase [Candidatus Pacebacteria bacterium]|nr:hydroxymethylglutaryl-CoA synthase [Candidatus Paceibacterota bacterium]